MASKMAAYTLGVKRSTVYLFLLSFLALAFSNPQKYPAMPQRLKKPQQTKDTILENAPWSIKLLLLKDEQPGRPRGMRGVTRRVGMEALVMRRQEGPPPPGEPGAPGPPVEDEEVAERPPPNEKDDDSNMRLKLFRLMYETVRDSDLKVKRAELIRKHYANSTAFEVGFLMGEVQEKFDVIVEFSGTLKKFYQKWKPIEHINAYEQIANYGIQINHLIDLIRSISKNGSMTY